MGVTAMVSRRIGERDPDAAAVVTGQAVWIGAVLAIMALWLKLMRKESKTLEHRAPTPSVKMKAKRVGWGYIEGVYHCEECAFAGHYFTTGAGPCHICNKKIHRHVAKWSKVKKKWIFKGDDHE